MEVHRDLMEITGPQSYIDGAYDMMFVKLYDPRFPLRLLPPYESTTDDHAAPSPPR